MFRHRVRGHHALDDRGLWFLVVCRLAHRNSDSICFRPLQEKGEFEVQGLKGSFVERRWKLTRFAFDPTSENQPNGPN
jgi:hypothetical protein